MTGLLIGILGSVIGGTLLLLIAKLSARIGFRLGTLAAALFRLDSERTYGTKQAAARDIEREILRSRNVRLLTGRGNELQRGLFGVILGGGSVFSGELRVLLPNPDSAYEPIDWLAVRERELAHFDSAYHKDTLRTQVRNNLQFIARLPASPNVHFGLASFPPDRKDTPDGPRRVRQRVPRDGAW